MHEQVSDVTFRIKSVMHCIVGITAKCMVTLCNQITYVDISSDMGSCDCSVSNVTCHRSFAGIQFLLQVLQHHVNVHNLLFSPLCREGGAVNQPDLTLAFYLHLSGPG